MLFSSVTFLFFFLPIVLLVHLFLGKEFRNIFLIFASLIFYFWAEQKLFFLLVISVFIAFTAGNIIIQTKSQIVKKSTLIFSIILLVSTIIYYKYIGFLTTNLAYFIGDINITNAILPVGISFFIFHEISYLVDVYKNPPKKNPGFLEVLLYICLFPQLIAGPIIIYSEIEKELKHRNLTVEKMVLGFRRFFIGLSKKILIANTLGVLVDN